MIDTLVKTIEDALKETNHRTLMSASVVQDLLLDIYNEALKFKAPDITIEAETIEEEELVLA